MKILIERRKKSHDFKFDKNSNDWNNNIKNNAIDNIKLISDRGEILFQCDNLQTVANHPRYFYRDTVAAGKFALKLFVKPRQYYGEIHGIIDAVDIEGQPIGRDSMQIDGGQQKGRWLFHANRGADCKVDYNAFWSGACFMLSSEIMQHFNKILKANGFKQGDILPAELIEVD